MTHHLRSRIGRLPSGSHLPRIFGRSASGVFAGLVRRYGFGFLSGSSVGFPRRMLTTRPRAKGFDFALGL
jgi:hypothetical protein